MKLIESKFWTGKAVSKLENTEVSKKNKRIK